MLSIWPFQIMEAVEEGDKKVANHSGKTMLLKLNLLGLLLVILMRRVWKLLSLKLLLQLKIAMAFLPSFFLLVLIKLTERLVLLEFEVKVLLNFVC